MTVDRGCMVIQETSPQDLQCAPATRAPANGDRQTRRCRSMNHCSLSEQHRWSTAVPTPAPDPALWPDAGAFANAIPPFNNPASFSRFIDHSGISSPRPGAVSQYPRPPADVEGRSSLTSRQARHGLTDGRPAPLKSACGRVSESRTGQANLGRIAGPFRTLGGEALF